MKKFISFILTASILTSSFICSAFSAEVDLSQLTGDYSDAIVSEGIAGFTTTEYTGTENSKAAIESVKTLGDNTLIITLDSYFPQFNIEDLKFQAYTSDWYSLKANLNRTITYSDYNISVNSQGKTVITVLIDQSIDNNRLVSEYSDKTDYSQSEISSALKAADNEITWQLDCGGWDKDYSTHKSRKWNGTESKITKGWWNAEGTPLGTIDNDATYSEMADIALAYALSGEQKYKDSFDKALDFIRDLQYESGGFAQVYPRRNNYSDNVTFNDDAMINVLIMLEKIEDKRFPYNTGLISEETRLEISGMIDKAIDYILKAQLTVAGETSAWCAQHHPTTYEPVQARAYEHPSVSGSESIGIIKFLLNQQDIPEAVAAAEAAIKWFDDHKSENTAYNAYSTTDYDGDGKIDYFYYKAGSTLWYRFYDLTTGVGFFADIDGSKHWDISEISYERRTGYSWAGNWPSKIITPYYNNGYYPNKIVVSVAKTTSTDINGKTLASGNSCSPESDNLAYSLPVNSEEVFLYGDATADNSLTATDAAMVLQKVLTDSYSMAIEEKTADYLKYIDVDLSGIIEAADAAIILQKVNNDAYTMPVEQ